MPVQAVEAVVVVVVVSRSRPHRTLVVIVVGHIREEVGEKYN